jgi:hypothetical protein
MATEAVLETLRHLWKVLHENQAQAALIGGLALATWRHPRATRDVDVLLVAEGPRLQTLISRLEQSGFKPKGDVTVEAGGSSRFTVEFDLRRNVVDPESPLDTAYRLKPTGLRLVNDATVGTISGAVAATIFPTDCTPSDAKVYLYDRTGVAGPFVADDMHLGNDSFVTSVGVEQVIAPEAGYRYLIGFVPAGTYAVSLTCDTEDDPNVDEDPFPFLTMADGVQVRAGSDAAQDLPPDPEKASFRRP